VTGYVRLVPDRTMIARNTQVMVRRERCDALRAYRRAETMGNAFRRPAAYRPLTDAHIADIFVRVDRYGRPPGV
jgi:hypothetical protein